MKRLASLIAEEIGLENAPPPAPNVIRAGMARNVWVSYLTTFGGMAVGFITMPLLIRLLGAYGFGLWALLTSILPYIGLLEAGVYTALSKRVSEFISLNDNAGLKRALGSAQTIYMGLTALTIVITCGIAFALPHLFAIPPAEVSKARFCILILGIGQCINFLTLLRSAALFGAGRMDLFAKASALVNIGLAVANVLVVWRGYGFTAMAWLFVASNALTCLIANRLIARHVPQARIERRYSERSVMRELLKYGSRTMVVSVAGAIAFGSDTVVIGLLLPVASITHYVIAYKLVGLVNVVSIKPTTVLLPSYAQAQAEGDLNRIFRLFTRGVTTSMAICLPLTLAFCFFPDRIITAWVGPGHEISYNIASILAIWTFIVLPGHNAATALTATERNVGLARLYAISAPINLALSFLLTRWLGVTGPALASVLMVGVVDFCLLPVMLCRQFGFSYGAYVRRSFTPLLAPAVVGIGAALLLRRLPIATGKFAMRLETLTIISLVMGVCWIVWLAFGTGAEERALMLGPITRRLRRQAA